MTLTFANWQTTEHHSSDFLAFFLGLGVQTDQAECQLFFAVRLFP